jgi:hypothetical protein
MRVKNINGTSASSCKCNSWLEHWVKFSMQPLPPYCSEINCFDNPEVGAHVQKDSPSDDNWYIIPLCKTHNAKTGESLIIGDYIRLVSANVSETCGK